MGRLRSLRRKAQRDETEKACDSKITLRQKAIDGCAGDILSESEYYRLRNEIANEMSKKAAKYYVYRTLAVAIKVIMENYNKIHVRKTRAENFAVLYMRGFESIENSDDIGYYEKYLEHWGIKILWPGLEEDTKNGKTEKSLEQ